MQKFKSENIYAYNILKSNQIDFGKDYSFLLSTLMHIESELEYGSIEIADFAQKLLKAINNSEAFIQVDRVCLSVTHPGSSRISVLSSFNSENLKDNIMDPGYSCFVSRESSIFKTGKTNVRTYANINDIVESYTGKPIQRSLFKLKSMGVVSGVTIPLKISNLISGFLFLNSTKEGAFNNLYPEDFTILCFLKLISLSALNKTFFGVNGIDSRVGTLLSSIKQRTNSFDEEEFKTITHNVLKSRFNSEFNISVENNVDGKFFYPLSPFVYVIVKTMEHIQRTNNEIRFTIDSLSKNGKDYIQFKIHDSKISMEQLTNLSDLGLFSNSDIGVEDGHLFMNIERDDVGNVDYSI